MVSNHYMAALISSSHAWAIECLQQLSGVNFILLLCGSH